MNTIRLSETETNILQLKVGRTTNLLKEIDALQLQEQIFAGQYDLVRLKVIGNNASLFDQLDKAGFPYRVFAVNYHNIKQASSVKTLPPDISIVPYEHTDKPVLTTMLTEILDTKYWIEYESEYSRLFLPAEKTKPLALAYFSSFNEASNDGNRTYFLKYKEEYAGVFMGNITGNTFYGTLYGILPEYRSKGLSKIIYDAMDTICAENNLTVFENDISIFNLPSQRSAVSRALVPVAVFYNILLFPLLSKSVEPVTKNKLPDHWSTQLDEAVLSACKLLMPPNFYVAEWKINKCESAVAASQAVLETNTVSVTANAKCIQFKIKNQEDALLYWGYCNGQA